MINHLKVALNISGLPVPEKINRSQTIIDSITANAQVFASPGNVLTSAASALSDLKAAVIAAGDGGKSKIALMHDKEENLVSAMNKVAAYVESVAAGDPAIVHLSGMDVKKTATKPLQSFNVSQNGTPGLVYLTTEPQLKTLYKWEYCKDPIGSNPWVEANRTTASKSSIGSLSPGFYWFRVVMSDVNGEHESAPMGLAVR